MGHLDWPFKLTVGNEEYTMVSQGFWTGRHYFSKVLQHVNGITGVWKHNDIKNDGYAQLINCVPGSISGPQADTSYVIYSRRWTQVEKEFMEASIKKICKDNPNVKENLPFVKMHEVLNISHYADKPNPNSSDPKFLNAGNELDAEAQQEGPLVGKYLRFVSLWMA
jgi:hypothetical protein